ncbi:MBL fold metallo-hydrolase [Vibrio sp. ZSDZ34]|uniref:MBL fold metallo-hydrolase n=1 Tax=Vibrio gelatinilyticus TaxID=2893468 RepID=A0A9X1WDD6_9VIBR|nr:alkyl sulfatase dimerization domain-containing protein [Vibrio gelatinilyticus]MCJ2376350.1 MBL fold metallo-hydrolase [Vibrio gelatinilyticus]
MSNTIKTLTATLIGFAITSAASAHSHQYGMSLHTELVTTKSGAITTRPQAEVDVNYEVETKHITEITDGVYRIAGWGIGNIIAINAPVGWIIIDTGDSTQVAKEQRSALEQKLGKPIAVAAILYTHSHYTHGTSIWADEGTKIYGHEHLVTNLQADSGISVLSGNFSTRAVIQFGMLHPLEGKDAFPSKLGFSKDKLIGESGFMAPDITFKNGSVENHTVAGLAVEVLPSQTDVLDSVAFYFPQQKLLVSNAMNSNSLFNLYTLRGDIYRDPMRMVDAADLALSRDIEYHVDIHGSANIGSVAAHQAITSFRDSMQLIHDQTYRGIAMGKDGQEIAEWIHMPESLRADKETYGQVESYAKQVYSSRIGWMGWDVYDINPLPKKQQAEKTVEAMGGTDAVIAMIAKAQAKGDIASTQWSLFLTTQLMNMGVMPEEVKQLRANAARTLGQHTTSANARGFYISEALLHEGKMQFAGTTLDNYQQLSQLLGAVTAEKLASSPLRDNVHYLRFMVDSKQVEGKQIEFNLHFTDEHEHYAIALRNGVIAITAQPNEGRTFELTKQDWDDMILGLEPFSHLHNDLKVLEQAIVR